ncbi:hypothetical protein [Rodentibacter pneumotropicus]|uniref:Uncharacterized protein n=1 Tax=Rodentibacter pneumotropicus TaxID=758 RepID=A0A1V3K4S6_9PAST|nr:hypothetical protein [Rodentibacter pneumotropicus]MCQ9121948.1 hypothetical protein [Rodentibacter pneumotropicus]MDC2825456.1 hypothetical protein [Rodentibacter pneumotropicus]OOF64612.1 hypothetical protein BKL50_01105 [Rodentibacter pneumotropicus]OOF68126.1 hypothetical protein BKG95_05310 [Rodentibacter pneumotropicus]THA06340.1 hypothetical protein D3M78_10865 [Rodentibacter pneumotropicus]
MLKYNAIQCTLFEKVDRDDTSKESLETIRNESENLCESIEYGLFAIGKMMEDLGNLTDERKQNFSHNALDNATVRQLGGLICANAYLLNALRDSAGNAEFHLSNMKGGK